MGVFHLLHLSGNCSNTPSLLPDTWEKSQPCHKVDLKNRSLEKERGVSPVLPWMARNPKTGSSAVFLRCFRADMESGPIAMEVLGQLA